MTDEMGVGDLEAPERDAREQSLPVATEPDEGEPLEILSGDLEAPEPDAIEQHQPALVDDDDAWR
ncbi:MAG: hypothetical protein QOI56_262 [Actinomycetota bacterium]|nr:hypothetical protein [Actinomycetota bacterium]